MLQFLQHMRVYTTPSFILFSSFPSVFFFKEVIHLLCVPETTTTHPQRQHLKRKKNVVDILFLLKWWLTLSALCRTSSRYTKDIKHSTLLYIKVYFLHGPHDKWSIYMCSEWLRCAHWMRLMAKSSLFFIVSLLEVHFYILWWLRL